MVLLFFLRTLRNYERVYIVSLHSAQHMPFMNIVSVYDVPDFFFVMELTEHTRPPICDTLNFNSRQRTHTNVLVCDREETNRPHKYAEHGHAEF